MNGQLRSRYPGRGRDYVFMGERVRDMPVEDLYAVIGYLLDKGGADTELAQRQDAPWGASPADPPRNDGLIEG
jgi:hypothetical protein